MSALARRESAIRACGLAMATMHSAGGEERGEPEGQVAGEVIALADRQDARGDQPARVGAPAHDAPAPEHEQRGRQRQQPQQRRRLEPERLERDLRNHPLRSLLASALPASPPSGDFSLPSSGM